MSGQGGIPGLTAHSEPDVHQDQLKTKNEAQPTISQSSMEMEVDTTVPSGSTLLVENNTTEKEHPEHAGITVSDAPPSPPSLTSALEAMLGGLDSQPQESSVTIARPNAEEQNGQTNGQEDGEGEAEWEEDSSPYESSSDSSSSDDSDDESEDGKNYQLLGAEETARILMEMEGGSDDDGEGKKGAGSAAQVRSKNELPEEVVPKPDVTITPEMNITELGIVEHIVENTVVIKANTTGEYQVLDSGSVLCTEDRTVIAAVADLIGNVRQPRYTARFTNEEEIKSYGLSLGAKVFYPPPPHVTYVFTQALRGQKGTDASNWHDEEAGDDEIEFSDDEKEAEHKRQLKAKKKGGRGGKGGPGGRGGYPEPSSIPPMAGLQYDDDEDDGPYRKLARPSNFAQGQQASSESSYANANSAYHGSLRGGRGKGQRGHGPGRAGRGNRGDLRGGHSLPPRPPRGQEYQLQPHQYNHPPAPPASNAAYPPSSVPFFGAPNGHQQPNMQFPFPWPQNLPQGFIPPPPPQLTGQQPGAGAYFNPEFLAALQSQMQGQPGQQNGQWPGHSGAG
ncbi:NAF1-domain-containing protein [Hypomontagnella submonticulosa]|nr:NAF1-domain-containing protein [Hypomontagnella submonticulosa]